MLTDTAIRSLGRTNTAIYVVASSMPNEGCDGPAMAFTSRELADQCVADMNLYEASEPGNTKWHVYEVQFQSFWERYTIIESQNPQY